MSNKRIFTNFYNLYYQIFQTIYHCSLNWSDPKNLLIIIGPSLLCSYLYVYVQERFSVLRKKLCSVEYLSLRTSYQPLASLEPTFS